MKIIALQGRANSGKTTTINMLHAILLQQGYTQIPGKRSPLGDDFLDMYMSRSNVKVGVTSCGDTHDAVQECLDQLINDNCVICVCACRTYDRIPPGTVAVTQSYSSHSPQYILKTISSTISQEPIDNQNDAMLILKAM